MHTPSIHSSLSRHRSRPSPRLPQTGRHPAKSSRHSKPTPHCSLSSDDVNPQGAQKLPLRPSTHKPLGKSHENPSGHIPSEVHMVLVIQTPSIHRSPSAHSGSQVTTSGTQRPRSQRSPSTQAGSQKSGGGSIISGVHTPDTHRVSLPHSSSETHPLSQKRHSPVSRLQNWSRGQ